MCEAWELAVRGSAYEDRITRYHYTGDMESVFVGSGLFEKKPRSFNASPGDVYILNPLAVGRSASEHP